ncbi:MAG: hypothetical protein M1546_21320 [Chloroflexi bacterium]|nr:hypothetical protein [Chloroflexota bacterium]
MSRLTKTNLALFAAGVVTLLAFGLRLVGLAEVPPRWDEGWSVAHASLNLADLFTVTTADVHPPLFYMLLGAWQNLVGVNLFASRYLAVLLSLPVIPLMYVVANVWARDIRRGNEASAMRSPHAARLALIAAALVAWMPLLVYYSAVIRMYALAPTFVLLATWAALRLVKGRATWAVVLAFVLGATGAMLTLYHAAWSLAGLGVYAAALAVFAATRTRQQQHLRQRLERLLWFGSAVVMALIAYIPWAVYALPQLQERAAAETGNVAQQYPVSYFLTIGIRDLTMSQQVGNVGVVVIAAIVLAGLAGWAYRRSPFSHVMRLALPVLMIAFTMVGVAAAARSWAFNARMLVCAAPALALLLAWSIDHLANHSRPLAVVACLALIGVYWNTSTGFVYAKTLEVFDPYNPHTYQQHISPQADARDIVFFNVLSPAGFYALDRSATDPVWSYALTWDPVIEPRERWEERITLAARDHARLWVVLYRGLAGKNGDLRGWLDSTFYPAAAEWGEEDVFYGLYGVAREPLVSGEGAQTHWRKADGFDLELRSVELPKSVRAGDIIPVSLTWLAHVPLTQNYKIFIHAFDSNGSLIAQHDAQPLNDLRPMSSLPVGEDVVDHHGLSLPPDYSGQLSVVAGIYDTATVERIRNEQGQETVEIGKIEVLSQQDP